MKLPRIQLVIGLLAFSNMLFGQSTWWRTYGGFGADEAADVSRIGDGSFLLVGATGSFGNGTGDTYLIRIDTLGAPIWSRVQGQSGVERGTCVALSSSSIIGVAGYTNSYGSGGYDGFLATFDTSGGLLTEHVYGSPDWDLIHAIDTLGAGFFLAGGTYTNAASGQDLWLLKVDASGDTVWTRSWGGLGDDEARSVKSTSDGGCVVAGVLTSPEGDPDAVMAKFDANGMMQWTAIFGGDSADVAYTVIGLSDGGYVLGGGTRSFSQHQEMLLGKVDASGAVLWTSNIGQLADWEGHDIIEKGDGGLVMAGWTEAFGAGARDMYLLYTNSTGYFESGRTYGGGGDDLAMSIVGTEGGGFLMAGSSTSFGPGIRSVFAVKVDSLGETTSSNVIVEVDPLPVLEVGAQGSGFSLYPVPAVAGDPIMVVSETDRIIPVEVVDATGRVVWTGMIRSGRTEIITTGMVPGPYVLRSIDGRFSAHHRMILLD